MKKRIVIGMMLISSAFTMTAHAAGNTEVHGITSEQVLRDYTTDIAKKAYKDKTSATSLNAQELKQAQDILMERSGLSSDVQNGLIQFIASTGSKKAATTDTVTQLIAAKNMGVSRTDADSKSFSKVGQGGLSLLANSALIGYHDHTDLLSAPEMSDVTLVLKKIQDKVLKRELLTWKSNERDGIGSALARAGELNVGSADIADSFVKAVMETQGVSKEKAMEIIRRFKDCV